MPPPNYEILFRYVIDNLLRNIFFDNMVIFFYRDGSNAYEYEPKCQADWNATEHAAKYAESMESAIHEECCSRKISFFSFVF